MITLQQGTIYLGTAAPASGGGGSGDAVWGDITGTLANQTDLATALAGKQDTLTAGTNISISNGTISATDTTYSAFTGADGSVAGSAGLVPAPAASDNTKFLKGDGTWGAITGIQNTATGYGALTILGTATNVGYAINIGNGSMITGGDSGVAVGKGTEVSGIDGIALGHSAHSSAQYAYQIGMGINNTTKSLAVGFGYNGSTPLEYQLLDGTTGKIPLDRMPYSAGTGVTIGNDGTISASGSVSYDNSTINENSSNQLQTIAVVNKNTAVGATNPLNLWEGTESQWNTGESQTWYNWTGTDGYFKFNSSTVLVNGRGRYPNLAYGDGKFMLIDPSVAGKGNISTNGSSWVGIDAPATYNPPTKKALTYGNGKFILLKGSDNTLYITEDFGTTWQEYNTLPFNGTYIYFANDKFFCFGSGTNAAYSSDGVTWTNITTLPSSNKMWSSISFGNGVYVATASSNSSGDFTTKGAYSTDGINWTETTLSSTASAWKSFYANGIFIAIPLYFSTGVAAYSTDGINWSPTTLPSNDLGANLGDVAFGKVNGVNRFIIFSNNGLMVSSTDGINWSKFNYKISDMSAIGGAAYGNEIFVISYSSSNNPYQVFWSTGGHTFSCFTTDSAPTTSSQVYSAPNTASALTITSVGTGTITLSDTNTYNYNASGNQTTTQSVGDAHPDWICLIEGVGIKKGSTTIASIAPTVDQTYDATSTNAQSGVAVASGISDTLGTINTQLESIIAQGD